MMRTPRLSRTTPAGKRSLENSLSIFMSLGVSGGMIERRKSPQEGQGEDWASRESVPVRSPNPALEPTASSFGFAYASGGGSPPALGVSFA
jgi:hypothetical protein